MYRYSLMHKRLYFIVSILSFGMAFITRNTSILIVPSLFLLIAGCHKKSDSNWIKATIKDSLIFITVFSPFIILTFFYNYYRFGSIFETGYSLIAMRLGLDFFSGTPLLTGLSGFIISPGKGFFYYSPVAILFFFSIGSFIRKNLFLGLSFILILFSYLIFLSKNIYWHGDWAWGPRYIFVLTPFFMIPVAGLFDSDKWAKKKVVRRTVYIIFSISFMIQIAAVSVDVYKYFIHLQCEENIRFTVAEAKGVQPIVVPPPEMYISLNKSPILKHVKFIYEYANEIDSYTYSVASDNTVCSKMTSSIFYNTFDFWWLYRYFQRGDYLGFVVAFMLFAYATFAARRLLKLL